LAFWNTKEDEEKERERMRSIKIFDHNGDILTLSYGIWKIKKSLCWLKNRGFEAKTLENSLSLLHWTGYMISQGFYQ